MGQKPLVLWETALHEVCKTSVDCKNFIRCLLNPCNLKNQCEISVPPTTGFLKALIVFSRTCLDTTLGWILRLRISRPWSNMSQGQLSLYEQTNICLTPQYLQYLQKGFQPNVINSWCCWLFNEWISHCCGLQYNYRKFGATWLQQYTSLSESWR